MPQYSFYGLGAILDPLFILNWLAQEERFAWRLLSVDGRPVPASNGLPLATETTLPSPDALDSVFVLASFETKTYTGDKRAKLWLRHCAAAGVELGGIEMGTEVLAAAGLLDECNVSVHWDNLAGFQELYPQTHASADLYSLAPGRVSCAGGSAVLDMMLAWLKPQVEPAYLEELRNHLLERRQRPGNAVQLPTAPEHQVETSAQVRKAIRVMRQTLETPLSAPELAARVALSARQLERRFKAELGVTPARYYLWLRINHAHRLLQQTDLSVAEVAACSGFGSLEHFSRVYRRFFDCAPSADRLQSRDAPVLPVRYLPHRV